MNNVSYVRLVHIGSSIHYKVGIQIRCILRLSLEGLLTKGKDDVNFVKSELCLYSSIDHRSTKAQFKYSWTLASEYQKNFIWLVPVTSDTLSVVFMESLSGQHDKYIRTYVLMSSSSQPQRIGVRRMLS